MKSFLTGLSVTLLLFVSPTLFAKCLPTTLSDKILPIATFTGTMNDQPIVVALVAKPDGTITGRYANKVSNKNIVLTGKMNNDQLQLKEFDNNNHAVGLFTGSFREHDPQGHFDPNSTLQCEVITGTWQNLKNGQNFMFYLRMNYKTNGSLDHMYESSGVEHDETINRAVAQFQQALARDNKRAVARMIDYPLSVQINQSLTINLRNQTDGIKYYDEIFNPVYKKAILNEIPLLLFSRYDGIALGSGLVWFNEKGKIIALNVKS